MTTGKLEESINSLPPVPIEDETETLGNDLAAGVLDTSTLDRMGETAVSYNLQPGATQTMIDRYYGDDLDDRCPHGHRYYGDDLDDHCQHGYHRDNDEPCRECEQAEAEDHIAYLNALGKRMAEAMAKLAAGMDTTSELHREVAVRLAEARAEGWLP